MKHFRCRVRDLLPILAIALLPVTIGSAAPFGSAGPQSVVPHGFCLTPRIRSAPAGLHAFSNAGNAPLPPADTEPEPVVIDVLFLYTPAALAGAGGEAAINARIDKAVSEANFRYTNSLINIHFNPVYRGLINYVESGSMETDWEMLAGYRDRGTVLSRAAALREDYKADIVYLLTETDNAGFSGISDIAPAGGNSEHAYGVMLRSQTGDIPMLFAHEAGHLFGGQHDREHAYDINGNLYPGAYPYSYGYRFTADSVTYVTVMGYQPGMYVPYFSNPRIQIGGVPAGKEGVSDNAKTMNQLAPYVARYRTALSRIEFTAANFEVSEADAMIPVTLRRTGDTSSATSVTVVYEGDSTARPGVDYKRPASSLVAFGANQATAQISLPIINNETVNGERVVHLSLSKPLGEHGIGLEGTTRITIHDDEPSVAFDSARTYVSESGASVELPLTFTGSFGTQQRIEIQVQAGLSGDSAKAGEDFSAPPSVISFTPQAVHQKIVLPIIPNEVSEPDRVFHVVAGNVTNEVHILDDDRDGTVDRSFARGLGLEKVMNMIPLPDGKLLITGGFTEIGGKQRTAIARLNRDGTLDDGFHAEIKASPLEVKGIEPATIRSVAIQPDGKILIAGIFSVVEGKRRSSLARLDADGTLDTSFNPDFSVDGSVLGLLVQRDGKIVIGGVFEQVNGHPHRSFARLNSDGTLDEAFQEKPVFSGAIIVTLNAFAQDSAGRILAGGFFQNVNGTPQTNLVRLSLDGSNDKSFNLKGGASGPVTKIVPLSNGQVLVGGVFDSIAGQTYKKIVRLNEDGSIDRTFHPTPAPNGEISDFAVLNDGRILVAGAFTKLSTTKTAYLTLLRPNGAVDSAFDLGSGPGDYCFRLALHANGSLFVSGLFAEFNHQPSASLARLRWNDLMPALTLGKAEEGMLPVEINGYAGGNYILEASPSLDASAVWTAVRQVSTGDSTATAAQLPLSASANAMFFRLRSDEQP